MEAPVRSREKDDELQRSTKKTKEIHRTDSLSDGTSPQSEGKKSSYKERLTGTIPGAYERAFRFEHDMETEVESEDESSNLAAGIAAVNLSGARKASITSLWTTALIIKVVGKTVGYQFLTSRIMSMWKPSGRLDCVDLGKDFFLMCFSLKEDYEQVLKDGPWFVGGHYLSLESGNQILGQIQPMFHLDLGSLASTAH